MQASKPSLPSIKFLLDPQAMSIPPVLHAPGLAMATSSQPKSSLMDITKNDIAQYHFPSKEQRQLPPMPSTLPALRNDILASTPPSHGHPHGHMRSYSDSTAYRQQPVEVEPTHSPHASYAGSSPSYNAPSPTASPSYLSPHSPQYNYHTNPAHYQYQPARQKLSPPLSNTPPHAAGRRPLHTHSRSMSDYAHPYATSLPSDSTYLSPPHHEPLRDKPHRFTPSHRRAGSASTIDYMLNNTHISPSPARAAESPRFTSPIPSVNSTPPNGNGSNSQDDDPEMDESSSNDDGGHSERSDSPSPAGKDAQGADQNRYVCPYCSKRFSRPSSLRIHTYSHTGEKPFVCTEDGCGRKFSVQSNMRRHLRVHRMGRTVKKVRYDGEVEGVRGTNGENGTGHARGNSGSSMDSNGRPQERDGGSLHRSGTI